MCAPAPFQSPLTGFGSSVAEIAEVLGDAVEQPAGHPQLVGHVERAQRAHLELPLAGHDLGVDAGDADAGVEARLEVRLDHVTAEHLVGADAAVVEGLRCGEAVRREAERATVAEERVLLLDAEERLLVGELLGDRAQQRTAVGHVRRHVGEEHLAHDEHVVAAADRVRRRTPPAAARSRSCCPAPGWCWNRRSPRSAGPCRPRGSWSSTADERSARCRRSRCTPPCSSRFVS